MTHSVQSAAAVAAATILVLTGCGSTSTSASDQSTLRRLVGSYSSALAQGNYAQACAETSATVQAEILAAVKKLAPETSKCATAYGLVVAVEHAGRPKLANLKIRRVQVNASRATISATATGQQAQLSAVREHGVWKIAGENTTRGPLTELGNENPPSVSFASQIKKYRKITEQQPNNATAWAQLAEALLHEAGSEAYVTSTGVTSKGKELFSQASQAWHHHLALHPPKPSVKLAQLMLEVYGEEGLNQPAQAVRVLQIVIAAHPNRAVLYASLAEYAYRAHETHLGNEATSKAVRLAPAAQRTRLRTELEQVRQKASAPKQG